MEEPADRLVFGQRIKHPRRSRQLTLEQLGQRLGRPASFLSMVENGKRRVRPEMVTALAAALEVEPDVPLGGVAPSRRAELEIEVEDPAGTALPVARAPLPQAGGQGPRRRYTHLVALLLGRSRASGPPETQEEVRVAAATMLADAKNRDGYLVDVEIVAAKALAFAGTRGAAPPPPSSPGPGGRIWLRGQARLRSAPLGPFGRRPRQRPDLHPAADALRTCAARSVVLQTSAT